MSGGAGSSRGLSQGWSGARVHASHLDRHPFHYSTGKGRSNPHRAIGRMPAGLGVEDTVPMPQVHDATPFPRQPPVAAAELVSAGRSAGVSGGLGGCVRSRVTQASVAQGFNSKLVWHMQGGESALIAREGLPPMSRRPPECLEQTTAWSWETFRPHPGGFESECWVADEEWFVKVWRSRRRPARLDLLHDLCAVGLPVPLRYARLVVNSTRHGRAGRTPYSPMCTATLSVMTNGDRQRRR